MLNQKIADAKAIEQGNKTDEAFKALQEAIATAEKAAANDKIPQAGVAGATEQLQKAIDAFNTSKDAEAPAPTPSEDQTVTTADGFKLVAGKEYALPVSFVNATTGEQSTAANFMEATATVSYADGSYSVTVTPNAQGKQFLTAMTYGGKSAVQNADGSFTISGVPAINKDITVSVTMPGGTVDMGVRLDTTSLPTASGEPVTPQPPANNNNGGNNGGGATTDPNGRQGRAGLPGRPHLPGARFVAEAQQHGRVHGRQVLRRHRAGPPAVRRHVQGELLGYERRCKPYHFAGI